MTKSQTYISLDVGTVRIGVAIAEEPIRIPIPHSTISADGNEIKVIKDLIDRHPSSTVVVGYPRNQSGDPTAQTAFVESFVSKLNNVGVTAIYQDESLTSVIAEQRLAARKKPYQKADIDAEAAVVILEDYLGMRG